MEVKLTYNMIIVLIFILGIGITNPFLRWVKFCYYFKKTDHFKEILKDFSTMEIEISKRHKLGFASPDNPRDMQCYIQKKCQDEYLDQYEVLRTNIAENIPAICLIASEIGISTIRITGRGGHISEVCIFSSSLEDLGYTETRWPTRFDTLNKMIGILKVTRWTSFIQIFNPKTCLTRVLKIPFFLLKATGFNVDKIEDSVWGHFFKLLFFIGLVVVFS